MGTTRQGGDSDDYWLYPTASNSVPTTATATAIGDIANPGTNVANYDRSSDWNGQNGNVSTVGSAGPASESFYGTADQGGNVSEWNETLIGSTARGLRGGQWDLAESFLRSSTRGSLSNLGSEFGSVGFRVASPIPEPTSVMLLALGGLVLVNRKGVSR